MTNVDEGTASRLIFAQMGLFSGKCCRNAASSADRRIAAKNGKHRTGLSSDLKRANLKTPRCSAAKCR